MESTDDNGMRVLKAGSCPSLSAKSQLGYELGCDSTGAFHVRLRTNTGKGYFSKDWLLWDRVRMVLEENAGKPLTSHSLSSLFKGQSVNNAGFLLAVLVCEGLARSIADSKRGYELLDLSAFTLSLKGLSETGLVPIKKAPEWPPMPAKKSTAKSRIKKS